MSRTHEGVPAVVEGWSGCTFILRYFLRCAISFFSSKDDREAPEILVADDLSKVLLREQPCGSGPTFCHRRVTPSGNVPGSLLNPALRAFDEVRRAQTFVKRRRKLQPL